MTNTDWRIHVLNHGPQLLQTARDQMVDANQAHLFVHTVMVAALGKGHGGALREMDEQLGGLVRRHASQQALA